jgi:hypothetical protein
MLMRGRLGVGRGELEMLHGLDLIRKTAWKTTNRWSPHDPLIPRIEQSCHYNIHLPIIKIDCERSLEQLFGSREMSER